MATEFVIAGPGTSKNLYVICRRDADEKAADQITSTVVTFINANVGNYDIPMVETPALSNWYVADLPAWMVGTKWNAVYYERLSTSPAITDTILGNETLDEAGSTTTLVSSNIITSGEYDLYYPDTTLTASQKTFLIKAISRMIENYCDFHWLSETRTEYVDGFGGYYLTLNGQPSSITSITFDPYGDSPTIYDGSRFAFSNLGTVYFKDGTRFYDGLQNYKAIYVVAGIVPDDLKLAACIMVQQLEQVVDVDRLVTEKSLKDTKIKYGGGLLFDINNPLFVGAKDVLAPHRHYPVI